MINASEAHVKNAIKANPGNEEAINLLVEVNWAKQAAAQWQAQAKLNQYEDSVKLFNEELKRLDELPAENVDENTLARRKFVVAMLINSCYNDASLKGKAGDLDASLARFNRIIELNPENVATKVSLTRVALSVPAKSEEAMAIYDPFSDVDPPAPVSSELGSYYMRREEFDRALSKFQQALEKNPSNPLVLNNLAYCFLKGTQNFSKAQELLDQAIQLFETRPDLQTYKTYIYDTQGKLFQSQGMYKEAGAAYQIALEGRPRDTRILDLIAECKVKSEQEQTKVESSTPGG